MIGNIFVSKYLIPIVASRMNFMNLIQRTRRIVCVGLAFFMVAMVVVTPTASAAPGLELDGLEPIEYKEGGPPVPVAPNVEIIGGGTFADGFIEFAITGGNAEDRLFLPEGAVPDTAKDAVTVIGSAVYLGLGDGEFKQIGTVNNVNDGREGRPLRIDFSASLPNADFSGGVDANGHPVGWTINDERVVLPASLATKTQGRALEDSTPTADGFTVNHTDYSFVSDRNFGSNASNAGHRHEGFQHPLSNYNPVNYTGTVQGEALHLRSQGTTCANPGYTAPFCSTFGPDAWSSPFDAKAGDDLAFDWRAVNIDDDYEVYGFLVDVVTGDHYELMYGRGNDRDWITSSGVIPHDGTYKFRFVSGTFDYTGGLLVGASLYIDNVRVLSADASAAVAQSVARLVHYENTGQNPPTELTIEVKAETTDGTVEEDVKTEIETVDDPPVFNPINAAIFTNTDGATSFPSFMGQIRAIDPEGDAITYSIEGGVVDSYKNILGMQFTHSVDSAYGKIHLNDVSGTYFIVPHVGFLDDVTTPSTQSFTVTASANGLSGTGTFTIGVAVETTAPQNLSAQGGDTVVDLSWTAPAWPGNGDITGYKIESSSDGGATWSIVESDTGSAARTYRHTGVTNGQTLQYRVYGINASGMSVASNVATATPSFAPAAPTGLVATPSDSSVSLTWTTPSDHGDSPITGYRVEISTDGGTSWTTAVADTGSADTNYTMAGLKNGELVTFRVAAINDAGVGSSSDPVDAVPHTTPGAPTITSITSGNRTVTVKFAPPASNGGSEILGYEYSTDGGLTWHMATSGIKSPMVIGPLLNGTTYPIEIRAKNAEGHGPASNQLPGTPATAPVVPEAPGTGSPTSGGAGGGKSAPLTVNGVPRDVTVTTPPAGGNGGADAGGSGAGGSGAGGNGDAAAPVVIRYADGDFHVDVAGTDQNGTPNAAGPNNELRMTQGGNVTVTGAGFEPGTTVDVWIMGDEPMLLGEATVGPDGTFSADFDVPESAVLGITELQVNGVGDDGSVRSLNIAAEVLGVTADNNPGEPGAPRRAVSPDLTSLAFTGSRVLVWTLLGLVLLVGGVASILLSTNQNRRDEESLNSATTLS